MVEGPHGLLGYHGPTPGYSRMILAYGRWLRLRVRRVVRSRGRLSVR
jgi:hypothetical protein